MAITGVALLITVNARLNQDGWLALVGGREVSTSGIPLHDRLTVVTHGVSWIDQQWLSQLIIFHVFQVGGLALYCILYVGLTVLAIALAIAAARSLGGADIHVAATLIVPMLIFLGASGEVRTQGFAYPLFVGILWLLAAESRRPTHRGYLLFPVLVVWANLHGSATLGAMLGVLHGISLLIRRPMDGSRRPWGRACTFVVLSPLCLLMTPYGVDAIGYYKDTLGNPLFRDVITEWAPVTSNPLLAVPFFAVAFGAAWLLGRSVFRDSVFDHLVLGMTIAGAIGSLRNVTWFGLAAIVLLPALLGSALGVPQERPRNRRVNLLIAGGSVVLLAAVVAGIGAKPASWFEQGFDRRAAAAVSSAMHADPTLRVNAGLRFSDWLLWREPQLAGRVAYDARLELLSSDQLLAVTAYGAGQAEGASSVARGYGLLVVDPARSPALARLRLRERGARVLYRGRGVIVLQRPTP